MMKNIYELLDRHGVVGCYTFQQALMSAKECRINLGFARAQNSADISVKIIYPRRQCMKGGDANDGCPGSIRKPFDGAQTNAQTSKGSRSDRHREAGEIGERPS